LKSHVVTRQTSISVTTSHNVDIHKMKEILTAPSLSFDWEQRDDEDEEGGLEVDIPDSEVRESKRDILRDQLRRSMSATQAKGLARADRSNSGLSRGRSSQDLGDQSSQNRPKQVPGSKSAKPGSQNSDLHKASAKSDAAQDKDAEAAAVRVEIGKTGPEVPSSAAATQGSTQTSTKIVTDAPPPDISRAVSHDEPSSAETATNNEERPTTADEVIKTAEVAAASASVVEPSSTPAAAPAPLVEAAAGAAEHTPAPATEASPLHQCPSGVQDAGSTPVPTPGASMQAATADTAASTEVDRCPTASSAEIADGHIAKCASTQDWPDDISPTNMWGGNGWASAETDSAAAGPVSTTAAKHSVEISPTLPFVPVDADAGQPPDAGRVEISPTVPFVPEPAEISPTVPFVPEPLEPTPAPVEISPTMPFVLGATAEGAAVPQDGTSERSQDATSHGAPPDNLQAAAGESGKQDLLAVPAGGTLKPLKRNAAAALSESEDEAEMPEGAADVDGAPPVSEAEARRLKEEREWLRQKRRKLREEVGLKRMQEVKLAREQRRAADVMQRIGTSMMSKEDQSRYEEVVAASTAAVRPRAGLGLRALTGAGAGAGAGAEEDEDAALFGGFRKGAPRRPGFLLGGSAVAS